jgi:alpha 1,3-glucosidase
MKLMTHQSKEKQAIDLNVEDEKEEKELKTHYIATESIDQKLVVLDHTGSNYNGDCWPGSSVYIDYLNLDAQKYFGDQYLRDIHLQNSPHVHAKNDMNEPSVFDLEYERTMPKSNIHTVTQYTSTSTTEMEVTKFEHRDVHNVYGILMIKASYEGMIQRCLEIDGASKPARAFLLTRSFYLGSQRYGAMWIGDTTCSWDHLQRFIPICSTISMAGFSFCGFDTPGFYKNPEPEYFVRGYQMGCLFPFFRAHADRETYRREPYLFQSPYKEAMVNAVETRYEMLMYYYTSFFYYRITGQPIMRPVIDYKTGKLYRDQVFVGDHMMAKTTVSEGVTEDTAFLPKVKGSNIWYRRHSGEIEAAGTNVKVDSKITELSKPHIFVQGGVIIPEFYDVCKNG